jgi:hypothetical protein
MYKEEDTTKPQRTPKNLLNFLLDNPHTEEFLSQLAKHHTNLKDLLDKKTVSAKIDDAKFIIDLNNFKKDLIAIAELCSKIDRALHARQKIIEEGKSQLKSHNANELIDKARDFYHNARKYDKHFELHSIFRRGSRGSYRFYFIFNPFRYNAEITNEENILSLVTSFKMHDDFFKNFINTLYSDGQDGENFLGKKFSEIASDYKKLHAIISEIEKSFAKSTQDNFIRTTGEYHKSLEKILAKYPATVHSATKTLLNHLNDSVKLS